MAGTNLPTPEYLRNLLEYDPETGALTWKDRASSRFTGTARRGPAECAKIWNGKHGGKPAFTANGTHGYKIGQLFGAKYKAHRVAWALHFGSWPSGVIDHINGQPWDNRITNLRDVTQSVNAKNLKFNGGASGHNGVYVHRATNKWRASIGYNGANIHLGLFDSLDSAISARKAAETRLGFLSRA